MTPRQIADRLNDQFRLLTGSSRTVPSRQATLRATVDWGHELLDRPEQALFRRLAVFSGGWTLEAAEAICGPWTDLDAVDGMTRLVDKSMVVREGDGNASRFRLLEPLRQYALEKLVSSEEVEDVRNRHLSWFANWAAESGDALLGRGQVEGLGLIDADLDNIRSALEWGVPAHRVEALELAASLGLYWQYRRLLKEGLSWLMLALDAAEASPGLRVRSLTTAGRLALGLHQHAQASQLITRGLQLAQDHELRAGAAEATWRLAQVAVAERDHQAAAARFAEAVAMAREVGDARLLSVALIDSAEHAFYLGEAPDEWIKEALGLARRAGDVRNASVALRILGEIQMANGVLDAALTSLREAVDLGRSIRGKGTVVDGLIELGRVLHASGQDGEARAAVTEALVLSNESDYGWGIAAATELAAQLLATAGDPRVARVLLAGASTLRQQIGAPRLPREALRLEAASAAMEAFIAPELVRHVEAGEPLDGVGLVALALSALAMNVS
jgi:tetratricopeptide (TPR) repeat protein